MFRPRCRPSHLTFARTLQKQFIRQFRVLGIETSCDDTCVALLDIEASRQPVLRHNIVRRSLELSEPFGGIIPNIVGNFHARQLGKILSEVRDQGGFEGLDLIAVTRGPGLAMCLATGLNHAKGLSVALNVPIIGVHHMQAHTLTPRMLNPNSQPQFPFFTLLISGGHTLLSYSSSLTQHTILIDTLDTAIGDYLDKVARVLLVPWNDRMPGAALEQWSQLNDVNADTIKSEVEKSGLPRPLTDLKNRVLAFSFAGLRSAVDRTVTEQMSDEEKRSLGRAAQVISFNHVADKVVQGMEASGNLDETGGTLVVSGGVACNLAFRKILRATLDNSGLEGYELVFPPNEFCSDNAAMIAWTGYEMYREGYLSDFEMTQIGKWPINELMGDTAGWVIR